MSEERDDKMLDAALGGKARGLSPQEAREAARLRAAYAVLAAGADPVSPPPQAKEKLFARIHAQQRRRAWGRWALAASVMLMAGAGFFARFTSPAAAVTAVSGDVLWNGRPVTRGQKLPAGATLAAAPGAWADLLVKGRAAVRLTQGGRLTLSRLKGPMEMRLDDGGLIAKIRPGTPFTLFTPGATATVHGTTFYVCAKAPDCTYICLCQGKLHIDAHGAEEDLATEHHAAVLAVNGTLREGGMEGHTDAEVSTLAAP